VSPALLDTSPLPAASPEEQTPAAEAEEAEGGPSSPIAAPPLPPIESEPEPESPRAAADPLLSNRELCEPGESSPGDGGGLDGTGDGGGVGVGAGRLEGGGRGLGAAGLGGGADGSGGEAGTTAGDAGGAAVLRDPPAQSPRRAHSNVLPTTPKATPSKRAFSTDHLPAQRAKLPPLPPLAESERAKLPPLPPLPPSRSKGTPRGGRTTPRGRQAEDEIGINATRVAAPSCRGSAPPEHAAVAAAPVAVELAAAAPAAVRVDTADEARAGRAIRIPPPGAEAPRTPDRSSQASSSSVFVRIEPAKTSAPGQAPRAMGTPRSLRTARSAPGGAADSAAGAALALVLCAGGAALVGWYTGSVAVGGALFCLLLALDATSRCASRAHADDGAPPVYQV